MDFLISVLNFTLRLLLPRYPQRVLPYISSLCYIHQYNRTRKYVFSIVPEAVIEKLVPPAIYETLLGDVTGCLLVDSCKFGSAGSQMSFYSLAVCPQSSKLGPNTSCTVRVVEVPGISPSTIVISETTYFNVKRKLLVGNNVNDFEVTFIDISPRLPRFATKASIGLMQSPIDVNHEILDILLSSFFETPRVMWKNDLFSIDALSYAPHLQFTTFMQRTNFVFKVVELEGSADNSLIDVECGLVISKNYTTLLQSNNQLGFLPSSVVTLVGNGSGLTPSNYKKFLVENCSSGFNVVYKELLSSFRPFLHLAHTKIHGLRPVFLLCGPRGAGKKNVISSVAQALGINVWNVDCLELKGNVPGYTEKKMKIIFQKVKQFVPCVITLRNIDALCKDHDGKEDSRVISAFQSEIANLYNYKNQKYALPVLLVATCNNSSADTTGIAPSLARAFLHVIHFGSPNEEQRYAILHWIIRKKNVQLNSDVLLKQMAARSSGFLYEDLRALVTHAICIRYKQYRKTIAADLETQQLFPFDENSAIEQSNFDDALELMQSAYSGAIGAPKIPAVKWNDIGGLLPLKEEIKRTVTMPLQHPELVASGLKRSGILLYGPPGTGKTLLAKAVATECNLNFLSVKGPELLNMYVGQSEENVREVFQRARAASPCIIFFDELDSLAPNRGKSGDSGGVMDRVVSQLLAEMDGMQKSTHLYLIGATNRPDLIDPALLRPGRFDKLLYVGVCEDHESQLSVMTALTRKFELSDDVDLSDLVTELPKNLTGADLFSVCSNAWLNAVKKIIRMLENGECSKSITSAPVIVNTDDFRGAIAELAPSVTAEDLAYFHQLHTKIDTR